MSTDNNLNEQPSPPPATAAATGAGPAQMDQPPLMDNLNNTSAAQQPPTDWWSRIVKDRLVDCKGLPPAVLQRVVAESLALDPLSTDQTAAGTEPDTAASVAPLSPLQQMERLLHHHATVCAESASGNFLGTLFQAIETEKATAGRGLTAVHGPPMRHVLSFLPFADRLPVAQTCKTFLQDVEDLSLRFRKEIMKKAYNRSDFDTRIRDQTNIDTPVTKRAKPVRLPERYLYFAAMHKSVNNIAADEFPAITYTRGAEGGYKTSRGNRIGALAVSPSGSRMAFCKSGSVVIWDLEANRRLSTIADKGEPAFLAENRIVIGNKSGPMCWSEAEDGSWERSGRLFETDDKYEFRLSSTNLDEMVVATRKDPEGTDSSQFKLFTVNIAQAHTITDHDESVFALCPSDEEKLYMEGPIFWSILGVCGHFVVMKASVRYTEQGHQNGLGGTGLYVYDLQKKTKTCYWNKGHVLSALMSTESPKTLCALVANDFWLRDGRYCILELNEASGVLTQSRSISLRNAPVPMRGTSIPLRGTTTSILAVSKSHLVVTGCYGGDIKGFWFYNLQTGELERSIRDYAFIEPLILPWTSTICPGRNELIMVSQPFFLSNTAVFAFCLREPSL